MAENGNGKKTNAVRLMVPITVVGVFMGFGIAAGRYVEELQAERAADRKRIEALERVDDTKLDKRDFQGWVRELQRDPVHVPEAPR